MIKQKVCSKKCFSLGFHIDFHHKYIDFHIWNYFIHLGDMTACEITDKLVKDEMYELQKQMSDMTEKHLKAYNKDWHPLII